MVNNGVCRQTIRQVLGCLVESKLEQIRLSESKKSVGCKAVQAKTNMAGRSIQEAPIADERTVNWMAWK